MKVMSIETRTYQGTATHNENVQRWFELKQEDYIRVLFVNTYTIQGAVCTMIFYEEDTDEA